MFGSIRQRVEGDVRPSAGVKHCLVSVPSARALDGCAAQVRGVGRQLFDLRDKPCPVPKGAVHAKSRTSEPRDHSSPSTGGRATLCSVFADGRLVTRVALVLVLTSSREE
jgi:hypothetical protein